MADILDSVVPYRLHLVLNFNRTLQYTSITADKFVFQSSDATPIEYSFKEVQIGDDYNSITRSLKLYFEDVPPAPGQYYLTIRNLKSALGEVIEEETYPITYDYQNTPVVDDDTDDTDFTIEDKTIYNDVTIDGGGDTGVGGTGSSGSASAGSMYVSSIDPKSNDIFIDSNYNSGVISVEFSERPLLSTLNSNTVKVQRKKVGGKVFKWENIPVEMAMDAYDPVLYIYLPSLDATPVYFSQGHDYFESGHKYRTILSKNIAYFKE